ncbi:MAG: DegT/DnrJ/EryC1/StrS family aminotransferase [Proteobacteria bacterium]|nr:DegT/DnrJ/EryC1/StrS family aminotransferase [Pseudomonadota bacterium]
MCECGEKLDHFTCPVCSKSIQQKSGPISLVDLAAQQQKILPQIEKNIQIVLTHGQYIMGPEVTMLEKKLAEFAQVRHAVSCSSGTDALLMVLMAYGIGPGDAVFTTPFTFIATAEVIRLLGATPVFVDIDPATFNLSVHKLEASIELVLQAGRLKPKAIVPVDLFGLPCDFDQINQIAAKSNLIVIEDAAQSFGAEYKGRMAGSLGHAGCTSFFPAKPLGCYGDGGAVFTDSDETASKLKSIRVHGKGKDKYHNICLGINGRLDTLQAAILLPKLEIFPRELESRRKIAKRYTEILSKEKGFLTLPEVSPGYESAWAQYTLLAPDKEKRAVMQKRLKEQGIPTAVYYPEPLHLQTVFADLGYQRGNFPVAEDYASRVFSIPMHPYLTYRDQLEVCKGIEPC